MDAAPAEALPPEAPPAPDNTAPAPSEPPVEPAPTDAASPATEDSAPPTATENVAPASPQTETSPEGPVPTEPPNPKPPRAPVAPPDTPIPPVVETAAPAVAAGDFASKLVAVCMSELAFFRNGALKETDEPAKSRIAKYWSNVGKDGWDGSTPEPWSAAFISYAVKQAGDQNRFKKSTGHAVYINDAISRKDDPAAAFQGKRIEEYAPQLGDLIARTRAGSEVTFDTAVAAGWYKSHTDVVTAIKPGQVEMIGGNVSNSVSLRSLPLLPDGRLELGAAKREGVFAILRCNL